ncbi:MAG: hypothetical protein JSV88_27425 [Candidatus Aminicenantes bacterium]|nr:MAG: hypothetical protein JSV88_27425 [Candidatus Aminicenantes bacterium]
MNKNINKKKPSTRLSSDIRPVLEYRWKLESHGGKPCLRYYGFQNPTPERRQSIRITPDAADIIGAFDGVRTLDAILRGQNATGNGNVKQALNDLFNSGIIVDKKAQRNPATIDKHRVCVKCINNDYVIKGLEFDEKGVCACCQLFETLKDRKLVDLWPYASMILTEQELLEKAKDNKSRFDVMVLFTGGKDSSYLLWYTAKKLGLRVMACNWDLPFANEASLRNMETARKRLTNVEFVTRTVSWDDIKGTFVALFDSVGYPCMCSDIAYLLFYPLAVQEKIPFVLLGAELCQMAARLFYTYINYPELFKLMQFGPRTTMDKFKMKIFKLFNPPLSSVNVTRRYLSQLTQPGKGPPYIRKMKETMEPVFTPLREALEKITRGQMPLIRLLVKEFTGELTWNDLNKIIIFNSWNEVTDILEKELNWKMPEGQLGKLHTSCRIERVKDYCQFQCFKYMRTLDIPRHIVEISVAVHFGFITREEGLRELTERGYYNKPLEMEWLLDKLELTTERIKTMKGVLPCIVNDSC